MFDMPFTESEWWKLPLSVRRRWWKETNYGEVKPTPKLLAIIREILNS